jgi:chromosome segregation ATPase
MAARKKVTRKVPPLELPPSATEEGRLSIQFEELRGDFRLAFEGIAALREDMKRGFQKAEEKAELRFSTLEASARAHSGEIRELKADVAGLKTSMVRVESRLEHVETGLERVETKLDGKADTKRVDVLEGRVNRLEKRPA